MIRWVRSRKLEILSQLDSGKENIASLWEKYELTEEEINEWRSNIERFGEKALRVTKTTKYRDKLR